MGYPQRPGIRSKLPYRKPSRWTSPPDTVVAYIAGIIDGEGSIGIVKGAYRVHVAQLAQAGLCDRLQALTGIGTVGVSVSGRKRPMARWVITRHDEVIDLLRATLPYLIVKRAGALAALAYCDHECRHDDTAAIVPLSGNGRS